MKNILDWIEENKQQFEGHEPRNMELAKASPWDYTSNVNNPGLEQTEVLRPGETLEEWEPNPFLKPHADGGRAGYNDGQLVTPNVDGSRPGYSGDPVYGKLSKDATKAEAAAYMRKYYEATKELTESGKLAAERKEKLNKFLKNKKTIKSGKLAEFLETLGYSNPTKQIINVKTMYPNLKVEKRPTGFPKGETTKFTKDQLNVADRYANLLNKRSKGDQHYVNAKKYMKLNDDGKKKIRHIMWEEDNKFNKEFSKRLRFDSAKEKILMKEFGLTKADFEKHGKFGVEQTINNKRNPSYSKIFNFVKNDFKYPQLERANLLSIKQQNEVMNNFELPPGEEWNFKSAKNPDGYTHGVNTKGDTENLAGRIKRHFKEKKSYPYAADRSTAKGWMTGAMYRVYKNQTELVDGVRVPKPGVKLTYKPIFNEKGIVIGFKDTTPAGNNKIYYGLKKYEKLKGDGTAWTKHTDHSRIDKFVDIAKRTKNSPNKVIQSLLKGKGIDPNITLNDILSYDRYYSKLSTTTPKALLESQIVKHHMGGVGAHNLKMAAATKDIQLLTGATNQTAKGLETQLAKDGFLSAADNQTLKNIGARVIAQDGTVYGGGAKTGEGQFAAIERQAAEMVKKKSFTAEGIKEYLRALCPKGKAAASGGRIGFNTAGAVLGSGANCGRNHMSNLLKNGTGTDKERNLIRQVMKASFDFAKGTGKAAVNLLNPKEFLKLKNWVGGPAIAFMAGVETLDVADRWIRQGIPIKEALGEKWTKFLMPRSLQEYQVEGMKEANALSSPASKRYAKGIELSNDLVRAYDQLEMLEKGEAAKFKKTGDAERIAELKKLIRTKEKKYYDYLYQTDEKGNVLGDGELDFKKDYNEYRATTKTGRDFTDLDIFGGMSDMGTDKMSGLKIKKDYFPMYEIGTSKIPSEQELAFDATLAKEPFVRERLVPLKQLKDFKYQNKELPTQDRINAENYFTEQGILPPRTSLSEVPLSGKGDTYDLLKDLTDDYNRIQKSKEARMYPGYEGSQFSEGGRAGYMGGGIASILKPSEIPPERGGLRSIMINDKKY